MKVAGAGEAGYNVVGALFPEGVAGAAAALERLRAAWAIRTAQGDASDPARAVAPSLGRGPSPVPGACP
jgi:hypothetical protein